MDRLKIKTEAKKIIKGKLWEVWKPYIIFLFISMIVSTVLGGVLFTEISRMPIEEVLTDIRSIIEYNIFTLVAGIFTVGLSVGVFKYNLNFTRGKEYSITDLFKPLSYVWSIVCVYILTSLIISLGYLLIIPGIILSFAYVMVNYVMADGEKGIIETLRKSRKMMRGFKFDYFIFSLSFLGWLVLGALTLGLLFIWLFPYMQVSFALYYDEVKKNYEKSLND